MTRDVQVLPRGQRSASPLNFASETADQPWLRFHPSATRWSEHSYTSVGCSAFSPSFGALIGSSTRENCNGKARGSFHGRFFCPPCFGGENCPNFGPTYQFWLVLEHFFYFFICWDDDPIWLIFFRGVGIPPTSQFYFSFFDAGAPFRVQARFLVQTWYAIIQMTLLDDWSSMVIPLPGSALQSFTAGQLHWWGCAGLVIVFHFPQQIPPKNRRIHGFYMILSICIPRWWVTFLRCGAVGCPTWSSTVSTFHLPQLSGRTSSKAGMVTGCNFFQHFPSHPIDKYIYIYILILSYTDINILVYTCI